MQYAKISREPNGGNYIVSLEDLVSSMDNELESNEEWAETGEKIIVEFVEMDEEEFNNLPEFEGW